MLPVNLNSIALLGKVSSKVDDLMKVFLGKDIEKNDLTDEISENLIYNFQIKKKRFTIQKINVEIPAEESINNYNISDILVAYFPVDYNQTTDTILKNHIFMANTFGIEHAIVVIDTSNTLDTKKFIKTRTRIKDLFINRNFKTSNLKFIEYRGISKMFMRDIDDYFVPDNKGKAKNNFFEKAQDLLLSINNVFKVDKNHFGINGKISCGTLTIGQEIYILPLNQKFKVLEIQKSHQSIKTANSGDNIGLMIKHRNNFIKNGMLITDTQDNLRSTKNIEAQLVNLNGKPIKVNQSYILRCHNIDAIGHVNLINIKLKGKDKIKETIDTLLLGEKGLVNISFREPLIITGNNQNKHFSRIAIIDKDTRELIGMGVVKSVNYK